MNEDMIKNIAQQLRKPHGEFAKHIGQKMNEGNLHINNNALEELRACANDHILEIGMGNGFFVKDMLSVSPSIRYAGCDFSEEMVAEASLLNKEFIEHGQAQFHVATADALPFADAAFNKALSVNTLYFWETPATVFAELRRVLQPNGELLLAIRPRSVMELYPFTQYGFQMFSKEELDHLVSAHGFTPVAIVEKKEPDQELNGMILTMETLIVRAVKNEV